MKRFSQFIYATLAIGLLFCTTNLSAQNSTDEATISQKVTDYDGNVSVKKKRLAEGESIEDYLDELNLNQTNIANIEIEVQENGQTKTFIQTSNSNTWHQSSRSPEFEELEKQMAKLEKQMAKLKERTQKSKQQNHNYSYNYNRDDNSKKRALLGIYPAYSNEGVMISSIVSGGGAQAAGMKRGDQVANINGVTLENGSDLRRELSKYEPGTAVTVAYVRDGQTYTTQSTLSAKRSYSHDRDPCKIFIGVQLASAQRGIPISGIIDGTAADKSTLQTGDVIIEMDGINVNSFNELLVERNKHQPGDDFVLTILREGNPMIVEAQFLTCDQTEEAPIEEIIEPTIIQDAPVQLIENGLQLEELSAFPNPTYGKFTLRFQGEAVPTKVRVTDITGRMIYSENLNSFDGMYNRELQIDNATPGNMIVTVQQGSKVISEQVLLLPRA
ncbi:MAG: PDZ domain-containing secreted protein [Paraglaciecola sp.]|jgi:PDZ domain-containing secreted protein